MKANITAAILAGGKSRRMGRPKALLPYRGKPIAQHLVDTLAPQVADVVIAGVPSPSLYNALPCKVLPDTLADAGPLAGLLAALQACPTPLLLCVPCDGVWLPGDFVTKMVDVLQREAVDLVYAKDREREQPLYALAKTSLQASLQDYLAQGGRKVIDWYRTQHYAVADFASSGFVFPNLNTTDDWQQFLSKHP